MNYIVALTIFIFGMVYGHLHWRATGESWRSLLLAFGTYLTGVIVYVLTLLVLLIALHKIIGRTDGGVLVAHFIAYGITFAVLARACWLAYKGRRPWTRPGPSQPTKSS